jgi:hypothetical protein
MRVSSREDLADATARVAGAMVGSTSFRTADFAGVTLVRVGVPLVSDWVRGAAFDRVVVFGAPVDVVEDCVDGCVWLRGAGVPAASGRGEICVTGPGSGAGDTARAPPVSPAAAVATSAARNGIRQGRRFEDLSISSQ